MRGKPAKKRILEPDSQFSSVTVSKLINYIMERGKKTVASRIAYDALNRASEQLKSQPLTVLEQAVKNTSPLIEVRSHRIGGANYQVPIEVSKNRRLALSLRWIIQAAKTKKGQKMATKLSNEIIEAFNNQGSAVKKKDDTHRMAESNKAFAHFAKH